MREGEMSRAEIAAQVRDPLEPERMAAGSALRRVIADLALMTAAVLAFFALIVMSSASGVGVGTLTWVLVAWATH